jgi:DNA transformation protein and related proteins
MRLSELKNLGAVTAERLAEVGIHTADDLETAGPVEAYRRVKERHPRETSLVLLYALQGALLGIHWNELPPNVKEQLKREVAG